MYKTETIKGMLLTNLSPGAVLFGRPIQSLFGVSLILVPRIPRLIWINRARESHFSAIAKWQLLDAKTHQQID